MEPVFRAAFAGPASFWDPESEERVSTEPQAIGRLALATGRLAIHDPGYEFAPDALDREVMPGIYLVDRALRSWRGEDGAIVPRSITAAVRVSFGAAATRSFVPVRSSDGTRELVFGVDSGLISIFDRSLLRILGGRALLDTIGDAVPEPQAGLPPAGIIAGPDGRPVFICQAGMGDGAYRAWWGLDERDEVVALIVDFLELEFSAWRTVEFPASAILGSAGGLRLALAGSGLEYERVPFESLDMPPPPTMSADLVALRRPAGQHLELRLLDAGGAVIGNPGHAQLFPGPWFEILERDLVERAVSVRVRVQEGRRPLEPL